jgi:hypothetical protein
MVHPATQRAVGAAVAALGVRLDIGFVFPPKPGEERGYGQWTNRDLTYSEAMLMLPRAAAANARGGNIYMRLGPGVKDNHPGVVLLDDLDHDAVDQLSRDGLEPCLVVETSSGNFQAWIRIIDTGAVPYSTMGSVARHLARTYGGDERAVSPRQPGRLPGFTNRKSKHKQDDGRFPFVRLVYAQPGRIASAGGSLLELLSTPGTAGAAAGATPETPLVAAGPIAKMDPIVGARLDAIYLRQQDRIGREVAMGRRPIGAASPSEVDYATALAALRESIELSVIAIWIARRRLSKPADYGMRTALAAEATITNNSTNTILRRL